MPHGPASRKCLCSFSNSSSTQLDNMLQAHSPLTVNISGVLVVAIGAISSLCFSVVTDDGIFVVTDSSASSPLFLDLFLDLFEVIRYLETAGEEILQRITVIVIAIPAKAIPVASVLVEFPLIFNFDSSRI